MDDGVFAAAARRRAVAEVEAETARLRESPAEGLALGLGDGRETAAGTTTSMLVHLPAGLPARRRDEALALHAAARHSGAARGEPAARMLDEHVLASYAVAPLVERAHRLLALPGGEPGRVMELRRPVDGTAAHLPGFRLAAA